MFERPPSFRELMVWAETGVPPEQQAQGDACPDSIGSSVVSSLERTTLNNETPKEVTTTAPRERMGRTWLQGAWVAGFLAAGEVVTSLSFDNEINWTLVGLLLVQAFVTGVVSYYHKNKGGE